MNYNDINEVKILCIEFIKIGCFARLKIAKDRLFFGDPQIYIEYNNKTFRFSDPDWNVVKKQLKTLLGKIKNEKNSKNEIN